MIARTLEAAGIPTVSIGNNPKRSELVRYPRLALTRFPRGATVGTPNRPAQQRQVLEDALGLLGLAKAQIEPMVLPYRWEGEMP